MEEGFRFSDRFGPEKILHIHDAASGLKAVVVVDNTACGPAIGGVRMAADATTEECFRLARAMSFKNAAAGLAHGGGKSVIVADPASQRAVKERLIRTFARAIATLSDYIPGPDMGTDETCMAWIHDEIGRATGLPPELGGIPLDRIGATGFGLAAVAEVAAAHIGLTLRGASVAIQGFGAVGRHAARFLAERGAVLIAASDTHGTLVDPEGIDVAELIKLKDKGRSVLDYPLGQKLAVDAVVGVACDIWIPAARPDVVRADNVDRLRTRLILEGANIPITEEAEAILHARGVVSVPDFIANAGGVICAAVEYHGGSESAALALIGERIRANTAEVLKAAAATGAPPRRAAQAMADGRLSTAMSFRRSA